MNPWCQINEKLLTGTTINYSSMQHYGTSTKDINGIYNVYDKVIFYAKKCSNSSQFRHCW